MKKTFLLSLLLISGFCFSQNRLQRFLFEDNLTNVANNITLTSTTEQFTDSFEISGTQIPNPNFGLFPGQEPFLDVPEKALRLRNNGAVGNYRVNSGGIQNLPASDGSFAFTFWLKVPTTSGNENFLEFADPVGGTQPTFTVPIVRAGPRGFIFKRTGATVNPANTHSRFEVVGLNGFVLAAVEFPTNELGNWDMWAITHTKDDGGDPARFGNGYFQILRNGSGVAIGPRINFDRNTFNTFKIGKNISTAGQIVNFDMDDLSIWDGMSPGQFSIIYEDAIKVIAPASQTVCAGSTISSLEKQGFIGATVQWFLASGAGAPANTVLVNNTDYDVAQTVNGVLSAKTRVRVTVTTVPAPTASAQSYCTGSTVNNLVATGTGVESWFAVATGGTALALTAVLTTGTYHVSQVIGGCTSVRTPVSVTITTTAAPTAAAQSFCSGGTVSNLQSAGAGTKNWYLNATGGTALATATALTLRTYHVSQTISNCESARVAVIVSVGPVAPPVINSTSQTFCGASTVADLEPSGSNIKWYAADTSGAALALTTPLTNQGLYYAAAIVGTCESTREAVEANLFPSIAPPTASAQTFCGAATVADLIATGSGDISWYATANSTTPLASTAVLTSTNYFVTQTITPCESARTTVAVTVGNSSTTWNGTSWSNGAPTLSTTAIFAGNFTSSPANSGSTSGDLSACNVIVNANRTVTFNNGHDLTVRNGIRVTAGGSLLFSNTANLIQNTTAANTGNISIEKTKSMRRLDYTYWGAGVTGQVLQSFSPSTLSNRFYAYDEVNKAFINNGISASTFTPGIGYSVRAPNTFTTTVAPFTGTAVGVPNNGDYSVAITTTPAPAGGNGFNLLANPYPSNIDAVTFLASNQGAIYFWTSFTQGAGSGNYAVWNNSGGTGSAAAIAAGSTSTVPNGTIAKGQGFMFKPALATTTSVLFTNSMRVANPSSQFFRTAYQQADKVWLNLYDNQFVYSQTLLSYNNLATNGFDGNYDAPQINETGTVLSSILDAKPFAIQTKGDFANTDVVPMAINIETAGNYNISIDRTEGIFGNRQNVFLKDNLTGTTHNLSQSAYAFVSTAGNFANRFELRYNAAALSVNTNIFNDANVIAYKDLSALKIEANQNFDSVMVYDIRGVLLFESKNINNNVFETSKVSAQNNVLLVKIVSGDSTITKKIIF